MTTFGAPHERAASYSLSSRAPALLPLGSQEAVLHRFASRALESTLLTDGI